MGGYTWCRGTNTRNTIGKKEKRPVLAALRFRFSKNRLCVAGSSVEILKTVQDDGPPLPLARGFCRMDGQTLSLTPVCVTSGLKNSTPDDGQTLL